MVCVKPFPNPLASIQAPVLHASTIQALPRLALMQAEDKSPLGRHDKTFVYLKLNSPRTLEISAPSNTGWSIAWLRWSQQLNFTDRQIHRCA